MRVAIILKNMPSVQHAVQNVIYKKPTKITQRKERKYVLNVEIGNTNLIIKS